MSLSLRVHTGNYHSSAGAGDPLGSQGSKAHRMTQRIMTGTPRGTSELPAMLPPRHPDVPCPPRVHAHTHPPTVETVWMVGYSPHFVILRRMLVL